MARLRSPPGGSARRIKGSDEKPFIDPEIVKRIVDPPMQAESRRARCMVLGDEELCSMIRRSNASDVVERKRGPDWHGISAGRMV